MKTEEQNTRSANEFSSHESSSLPGKVVNIVTDLLQPNKTWGAFTRKMLSLLAVASICYIGYDVFIEHKLRLDKFVPVSEMVVTRPDAFKRVKEYMENTHEAYHEIKGIWLYSWPDSSTLDLIHSVGQGSDPIPAGAFRAEDADQVGRLSLNLCTKLNVEVNNTTCSIYGNGDAWGILMVVWNDDKPHNVHHTVKSLTHRIEHLLYHPL